MSERVNPITVLAVALVVFALLSYLSTRNLVHRIGQLEAEVVQLQAQLPTKSTITETTTFYAPDKTIVTTYYADGGKSIVETPNKGTQR